MIDVSEYPRGIYTTAGNKAAHLQSAAYLVLNHLRMKWHGDWFGGDLTHE